MPGHEMAKQEDDELRINVNVKTQFTSSEKK